jgi:DNA invertase Pin-like site-specific DNA recombinase
MVAFKDVALYGRVSTQGQNIETQLREAREYCVRNGVLQYKEYADVGISGAVASRPLLDSMLTDLRAGRIKTIIVYKLDRLGRSLKNLLDLLAEFKNRNIRLISIADGLDTANNNAMNRAFWQMLAVFAELERSVIVDRIMSGLERAKSQGKKLGRPAGSKDKGQRSRSGYFLRYSGRSKNARRLGKRIVNATQTGVPNDPGNH